MKYIKKYTIVQKRTYKDESRGFNGEMELKLSYGSIDGPYYSQDYPEEIFDTEEEAIEYAYGKDKWAEWLIIPIIKFDNY